MANLLRTSSKLAALLLFLVTFVFATGCKKTAEGEAAKWDAGVGQVKALIAQYPGFKPALEARLQKAQAIYDAAASLADEAKVDKMAEANTTLRRDFVADLGSLDDKMKQLREKRVEAAAQAGDASTRLGAQVAAEDAQKALDRAEKALEQGAADEAAAVAVLDKIEADLDAARAAIDKVVKADKDKKAAAAAAADADAQAKAAAEAKVAPWKCEYCGTENKHDQTSCSSCGAPRGDTKK
jgi:DNA repair exonuclease SbcCD ATPase subunit